MGIFMKKNTKFEKISDLLLKIANFIFLTIFTYLFVRIVMKTKNIIPASTSKYILMLILWGVYLIVIYKVANFLEKNSKYQMPLLTILLILQIVYVWAVHSRVDSDAYVINYIAYNYVTEGKKMLTGFWSQYLAMYTNNIPATAFLYAIYKIWIPNSLEESWLMLSLISAILSDLALYFIYKLVNALFDKKTAIFSFALTIPLISLSEPSTILYTDIMALWTTPAALYFLVFGMRNRKWKMFTVAGLLLAFGAWLKVQSLIVAFAIIIWMLLESMKTFGKEKFGYVVKCGIAFCSGCVIAMFCLLGVKNHVIEILDPAYVEQNEMPALHFVAMGLNIESNGTYSLEDVNDMTAALGQEAKNQICKEKISARLEEMGAIGLLKHLDKKMYNGLGRGTFTSAREWRGVLLNETLQGKRIQNWTVVSNERFDSYTAVWIQTGYILILFTSLCSAVFALKKESDEKDDLLLSVTSICRIAMIGIVMMLCLLERNLRYMYAMLPCMVVLFMYVVQKVTNCLEQKRITISNQALKENQ